MKNILTMSKESVNVGELRLNENELRTLYLFASKCLEDSYNENIDFNLEPRVFAVLNKITESIEESGIVNNTYEVEA